MMRKNAQAAEIALLCAYRRWLSPILPPACRYLPTCSEYGVLAIERYGPLKGAALTLLRLLRCHPLARSGFDPVR